MILMHSYIFKVLNIVIKTIVLEKIIFIEADLLVLDIDEAVLFEIVKFLVEIFCGPLMRRFSNIPMPLSVMHIFLPVSVQSLPSPLKCLNSL